MKVTFKDLKQQKFTIEFEPSTLVSEVKEKLSEDKGWEAADQKLIYSGKILKDDQSLESYNIEEKGYVVCMVSKPKAPKPPESAPVAEPATPAQASTSTPAAPPAPSASTSAQAAPPSTPTPQRTSASAQPSAGGSFNDPSNLTVGAERAAALASMEAMGFERAQIERAMRAAFFNPDRAVEYLLTGIPENVQQEQQSRLSPAAPAATAPAPASAPAAAAAAAPATGTGNADGDDHVNLFDLAAQHRSGAGGHGDAAGDDIGNHLEFLRNNPQFQQLRQVVQQNPQMLEPLLQQLGSGNPHLAQMIANHPDQFLELLSEDADDDAPLPPGAQSIAVTEEERDAIERLCRLGFDRDQAIQAYFACDKNEELAANFLFDQPDDDDPAQH